MNAEDFCTYEQALALKKLGFRESCLYHYNILNELVPNQFNAEDETITVEDLYDSLNTDTKSKIVCDVPTLAQAQKWLRNGKGLSVEPFTSLKKGKYTFEIIYVETGFEYNSSKTSSYLLDSYEEALSVGIDVCLKLLEDGTNRRAETNS